jgi:carboxymethylenebutenolidase
MLDERNALFPPLPPLSRRGFVAASAVTAGYTLAAGPVMAQTIVQTDTQGLTAGDVKIPVSGGEMGAYRAKPASGSGHPTVVVCQEIFGIHEYIKDTCRRLAKAGYLAVAPDYYFRQGDPSKAADTAGAVAIANRKPDTELLSDLDATARWATTTDGGSPQKLAVTGFCRGGRATWMYSAHNPNLKAAVAWYGPVVGQGNDIMPKFPIDLAAEMKCPVLGLYGSADTGIPVDTVKRMEDALKAANKQHEFMIYPEAPHGFHADYRPTYRADPAKDGWNRMLAWFKKYGVA